MKKILIAIIILITGFNAFSQCREFTMNQVVPKLGDFLLTGKYHAMVLTEGEEILIYKTVNQGIQYRFVIGYDQNLPTPEFYIINENNKILFNNEKKKTTFDYKFGKTERIKIIIKVPETDTPPPKPEGCVSLIIGIKKKKKHYD